LQRWKSTEYYDVPEKQIFDIEAHRDGGSGYCYDRNGKHFVNAKSGLRDPNLLE
jgi:hypothetical protein